MSPRSESILDHIADYLLFLSNAQLFWFMLNTSYDHGCHLRINSVWCQTTMRFFSLLPAYHCTHTLVSQSRSTPQLGGSSLVAEALADPRQCHEERLHDNQPEWTRCMRGEQRKAMVQRESEALIDGRCRRDERQCDNHLDKRHKRGVMRGSGAMRSGGAGGQEGWCDMT
jgi:hypothetical protein